MRKIVILFFPLILFMGCYSTKHITGKGKIKRYIVDSQLSQNHLGIKVLDVINDKVLIEYHTNKAFTPASNTKILTFYVTDEILPDSIPTFNYCEKNDTLFFSGLGDPTFLHPEFKTHPAYKFLQNFNGKLVYSIHQMKDKKYGPGWAWDDYPYYFQAEKSASPIYGNSVWIEKKSNVADFQITPSDFAFQAQNPDAEEEFWRDEYSNTFYFKTPIEKDSLREEIPFITSDSLFIHLLGDTLKTEIDIGEFPENCRFETIYNQRKDTVFKRMLVESDNFFAEQLLLSSSKKLFNEFDSDSLIEYGLSTYFPEWKDEIKWRDGSGLSRYNIMNPNFLVEVLKRVYRENTMGQIIRIFPDGGKEGTLDNFLHAEPPFVFAKSGSMTGVYNLSGYLIADSGRILIFSVMNNNFNRPVKEIKMEVEELLLFLKSEY